MVRIEEIVNPGSLDTVRAFEEYVLNVGRGVADSSSSTLFRECERNGVRDLVGVIS